MLKIAVRTYVDTYKEYTEHVFSWDKTLMLEFFGFGLDFVKAMYPDGYVSVEFVINPEPEEDKEKTDG